MDRINYCVLAKSVPEFNKTDDMPYTCSLGYTVELGLIRVYPLPLTGMNKWHIYSIPIERNKRDSRKESWKLSSYSRKENWLSLNDDVKLIDVVKNKSLLSNKLLEFVYPSIKVLNDKRLSVGLVPLKDYLIYWRDNANLITTGQYGMFEDVEIRAETAYTKDSKMKVSYIRFSDEHGDHDIQYNEWYAYEGQRKFGASPEMLNTINGKSNAYLMVGNMNGQRTVWIGLGIFQIWQPTLF